MVSASNRKALASFVSWVPAIVLAVAVMGAVLLAPAVAAAKIQVVASVNDLGSIAASVGGDQVEVRSIARGNSDPHRVEVLPSYMVRVSKAKVYLKVGLQLDQWADQIIDGSRNDKLLVVDCSKNIAPLEKPTTRVDARQGDVHPNGNPHYWLDPRNAATVAQDVAEALAHVDPDHAQQYYDNADAFAARANALAEEGAAELAKLPVKTILCYHASWIYFTTAFGLETAAHVEPVPGIPPTGRHLQELLDVIKERGIKVLIQEPYFSKDAGEFLQRGTDIVPVTLSPSCDDVTPQSYFDHIQNALDAIVAATRGA